MSDQTLTTLLNIISALGAIASPVIVLILSNRIESARQVELSRVEKIRRLEEELRDERIEIYNRILEPFILSLSSNLELPRKKEYLGKTPIQVSTEIIRSLDYRQATYKLALVGTDEVVLAFSDLLQFFFTNTEQSLSRETGIKLLGLLGTALLAIRKSVGNEETALRPLQMLEMMITDIKDYQQQVASDH